MLHDNDVVILSAARTAIGKFQGTLSSTPAPELGAIAIREAVRRAGLDPVRVAEVIMGNVVSAGLGQAPARQAGQRGDQRVDADARSTHLVVGAISR